MHAICSLHVIFLGLIILKIMVKSINYEATQGG